MRTFPCFAAAFCLSLAPRLALAQAAPAAPAPLPDGATVVVVPAAPAYAPPPPVWYAAPTPDPIIMRRRSSKLMIAGLVMIPVGLAMAIGGGVWASNVADETSNCAPRSQESWASGIAAAFCGIDRAMGSAVTYSLAITGGAIGLSGVVMAITGGTMVPAKPGWRPAVSVGAGSASLRWTF